MQIGNEHKRPMLLELHYDQQQEQQPMIIIKMEVISLVKRRLRILNPIIHIKEMIRILSQHNRIHKKRRLARQPMK